MVREREYMTGREELQEKVLGLIRQMQELRKRYFPPDIQFQYSLLLTEKENHEEYLRTHSDDEIEKIRFWERSDGPEKCPIRVEDPMNDSDFDKPLKKLCTDIRCPDFEGCWATKQFEMPVEFLEPLNDKEEEDHR